MNVVGWQQRYMVGSRHM